MIAPFDMKSPVTKDKHYFSLYLVINIQIPRASESSREKKKKSDVCDLTAHKILACKDLSLIVSQVSIPDYIWPFLKV